MGVVIFHKLLEYCDFISFIIFSADLLRQKNNELYKLNSLIHYYLWIQFNCDNIR